MAGETQSPQAPKGQGYGIAGAQIESQKVQPIAGAPTPGSPSGTPTVVPPNMDPGTVPSLSDPTAMPEQPVTAGLTGGPGPGMEGLSTTSFGPPELAILRGVYLRASTVDNEDLRRLIEFTETRLG